MARPTQEQIRNIDDFSTVFRWNLYLTPPRAISNDTDLNMRCESVELPGRSSQPVEINMRGFKTRVNGIWNFTDSISLVFLETVDNKISQMIRDWMALFWDTKKGTFESNKNLKVNPYLERLDSDDQPIWRYQLFGCFIDSFSLGSLDGSSSDIFRPSVVLGYDYYEDGPV